PLVIRAKSGQAEYHEDEDILTLILYDGELHQIDEQNPDRYIRTKFKKHLVRIGEVGNKLYTQASEYRGDREMSTKMMQEKIAAYRQQIESYHIEMENIINSHFNGDPAGKIPKLTFLSSSELTPKQRRALVKLRTRSQEIEIRQRNINKYLVEVHKKYSIPAACIVFTLVGVPLGIMAKRGGMAMGFGISIGFFLLYWAFLIGGEELADRMIIPPALAMWAPNIIIGIGGILLIIHSVKQITFFRWEKAKTYLRKIKH
ncbi:MAG: LptF/LptG family permease, partial [Candidatus Latescibacteria bacterium]|nr:LptF/LptG family permease [Candidatus Latescibacterota bacterium]